MTWSEFVLKRSGFLRQNKEKWTHTRFITYYTLVASGAIDTKKLSIDRFMPLDDSKIKEKNKNFDLLKAAQEKVISEAKKAANNGR